MIMKTRLFSATLALALLSIPALYGQTAQDGQTPQRRVITVEEAVALAMENNIQLNSASIDVRMKKRAMNNSWNAFIPSVQTTGTLAKTNMTETTVTVPMISFVPTPSFSMTQQTIELEEEDRWTALANLSATLTLNMALFEGLKATRQGYEAGLLTWEQARLQTAQNVQKSFYGILLQTESLKLAKDKLAASEERLRQVSLNYRNGLVSELNYLQAQLGVETQKPQIMEAELNLNQQKSFFAFTLGLPLGTELELQGTINPIIRTLNADDLIRDNLANRLDLAILRKNLEILSTQLSASRLQRFTPSFSISQSFAPRLSPIDADWLEKDNWKDNSGAFSVTMAFNLTNLLPFSASGTQASDVKDNLEKLNLGMSQARYSAELEVRNLVRKLQKSVTSIQAMEFNVSIAEKAYRLTEQGYKAGTTEYLDLKDAENSLMQARLGVLSEKFTYVTTTLDLETALNMKFNQER